MLRYPSKQAHVLKILTNATKNDGSSAFTNTCKFIQASSAAGMMLRKVIYLTNLNMTLI